MYHPLPLQGSAHEDGSAARALPPGPLGPGIVACLSPSVLMRALLPTTGIALWQRPAKASLHRPASALCALPPFCHAIEDCPDRAIRMWSQFLPSTSRPLLRDVLRLANLFAEVTSLQQVRLRLEHMTDNACRCFHVDNVGLRMLCTYAGPGTEWLDAAGRCHRILTGQVAILKGAAYPDMAPRIRHRSPPVEHLPPGHRSRLLLCIDAPGHIPLAASSGIQK
jgi:hypothetical protein